jgi:hypothetical protein
MSPAGHREKSFAAGQLHSLERRNPGQFAPSSLTLAMQEKSASLLPWNRTFYLGPGTMKN